MNDPGFWTVFRRETIADRNWKRDDHLIGISISLFAASVLLEIVGVELWLLRPVVVVPVLTFVPGYLLLRIIGIQPRDFSTGLLYSLGLSLVSLMVYGFLLNSFLPLTGVSAVFTEGTLFASVLLALCGLYVVYIRRTEPVTVPVTRVTALWQPWTLGLLSLPLVAVLGARTVTRFGNNAVLLGMLAAVCVLVVAGYLDVLPQKLFPLAIVAIAASLLLHNSVLTHDLAWDAGKEMRLAGLVIENGVWDPNVGGRWMKNAMLRIVLLHPIYSILADIDLLWEFKTVSPLLFAFAPLAFYKAYQTVVDRRNAFLAIVLPMSFFSFFTVLAWNSRTSGALLFLGLFALSLTDRSLGRVRRRVLTVCFLFGVIVSHYGMAYITLAAMPMVVVGLWVLLGPRNAEQFARTTATLVLLTGILALSWYTHIVHQAGAFDRLVTFSYGVFTDTLTDLLGSEQVVSTDESVTAQYATARFTSNTITWLKQLYIVLGAAAAVGVGVQLLRRLWSRFVKREAGETPADVDIAQLEYLLYATAFLGVFGLTFVGVDKLNTARTLMPALLFFAPFVLVGPRLLFSKVGSAVDVTSVRRGGRALLLAFVLVFFALNVGLYGSAANEYHPNILIDKDRVIDSGTLPEKKYFWAMHYGTIFDQRMGTWMDAHAGDGEYESLDSRQLLSGMYNCTGVPRQPRARQGSCDSGPTFAADRLDKVYATTGSEVYYNSSASP